MSAFDPGFILLGVVVLAVAVLAVVAIARVIRARRRARRRVVERPNSHFTPQLVRERENRNRWHAIALDRVHEVNREEVVRLLAKVDATGVQALRPDERRFLDYMAELAGTEHQPEPRERHDPTTPELRHRPA